MNEISSCLREEGLALLQAGRAADASAKLEEAVGQDSHDGGAWGLLGVCQAQLGDRAAGISSLRTALEILPNDAPLRYNLAVILDQVGQREAALEEVERSLRLRPDHPAALGLHYRLSAQKVPPEATAPPAQPPPAPPTPPTIVRKPLAAVDSAVVPQLTKLTGACPHCNKKVWCTLDYPSHATFSCPLCNRSVIVQEIHTGEYRFQCADQPFQPGAMYSCPKCGSAEAHAASVVYRSQTSSINANTVGGGVGLAGGAGLGVATTSGVSQSLLAQQAAPPSPPSHVGAGCGLYVVLFCVFIGLISALTDPSGSASSGSGDTLGFVVLIGGGLGIAYWMGQLTKSQMPEWEQRVERWRRTWVCDRCGAFYVVPSSGSVALVTPE